MEERSQKIHEESIVIDAVGVTGFHYSDILAGGINATHVTLAARNYDGMDYVIDHINQYYGLMEMAPESVMLVEEAQDIQKAKQNGKLGIILGFQNASPLGENVTLLPIFHKLGVRIIQLTYNEANALGCGCLEPNDTGLTSFGIQVIQNMNRLGILVDLSHTGKRTSRDAIEVSDDPIAFTHANPSALKDHPRNKPDELIRMATEKGGVIGLTPYTSFCKSAPGKRATLEDFLDHIDYVVQLVGIDNVGIGTDKAEKTELEYYLRNQIQYPKQLGPFKLRFVEGFPSIRNFPHITEGLLSRGYSDEDCAKIIGGNFYSLFQKVWKNPGF
jgi:membrane dipeptidase